MLRRLALDAVATLPSDAPEVGQAEGRFRTLGRERDVYLREGECMSALTIPYLIVPEGQREILDRPWHSAGFEGVSHLAAKFTSALFPPEQSFFRFETNKLLIRRLEEEQRAAYEAERREPPEGLVSDIDAKASAMEQAIMREFKILNIRSRFTRAFQHLLIGGNALLEIHEQGSRLYGLESYAIERNGMGHPMELIIKEKLNEKEGKYMDMSSYKGKDEWLYTRVFWDYEKRVSYWWQENSGEEVPRSRGAAPINACPWIPMRYEDSDTDYSRPFIEIAASDLAVLNYLTRALTENTVERSRLIRLVRAGSQVRPDQLRNARNGDYITGDPDAVATVQGGNTQDMSAVNNHIIHLEQRVHRICGMPISVQRPGERVSATEIQLLAVSLDAASTGFYSIFAAEVQPKIVTRLMHLLSRTGLLDPQFISDDQGNEILGINPVTGLEALGRESDVARHLRLVEALTQSFGPEITSKYLNVPEIVDRIATGLGVNVDGLIVSEEEIAAQEQAQAQAAQQAQAQAEQAKTQQAMIGSPALGQAVRNQAIVGEENTTQQPTRPG